MSTCLPFQKILLNVFSVVTVAILLTFSFVAFLGLSLSMPTDMNGKMENCPWTNTASSVCPMNVNEHIANWQQLFSVNPRLETVLALLLLVSVGYTLFAINKVQILDVFFHYYQRYKQEHPDIFLFNYFHLIFADGILQPKLYA